MADKKEPLSRAEIQRRYRERHNLKKIGCTLQLEQYNKLLNKLEEIGTTQQDFLKKMIESFLEE